jgi:hypothetical protein
VKALVAKPRYRIQVAIAVFLAVPAVLALACAPKNSASGAGQECFVATDCEPGLVCVPQRSGARVCSADLSQVTGRPPAEPNMPEAGDATTDGPVDDAPGQESGVGTGIADAGDAG